MACFFSLLSVNSTLGGFRLLAGEKKKQFEDVTLCSGKNCDEHFSQFLILPFKDRKEFSEWQAHCYAPLLMHVKLFYWCVKTSVLKNVIYLSALLYVESSQLTTFVFHSWHSLSFNRSERVIVSDKEFTSSSSTSCSDVSGARTVRGDEWASIQFFWVTPRVCDGTTCLLMNESPSDYVLFEVEVIPKKAPVHFRLGFHFGCTRSLPPTGRHPPSWPQWQQQSTFLLIPIPSAVFPLRSPLRSLWSV